MKQKSWLAAKKIANLHSRQLTDETSKTTHHAKSFEQRKTNA